MEAYLGGKGFVAGPHYSDADAQSLLDAGGYVPGPHLTLQQCLDGVAAQGYLKPGEPIPASMLPPDGLDEVSNQLITATFDASFASTTAPVVIVDGFLAGVVDSITIPDLGTIQELNVDVNIEHTSPTDLKVVLVAPSGQTFVLRDHGPAIGGGIVTNFDLQTKPLQGDLSSLDGKNPAGQWTIKVVDDVLGNGGKLVSWKINVVTLSAKKVFVDGSLEVSADFSLSDSEVTRASLEKLTAGQASSADALHTHTNLGVYFKEDAGLWSGGGKNVYDGQGYQVTYSGSFGPTDPSTSHMTVKTVAVSGNHAPGWAGYVCFCAKGSISVPGGGQQTLDEKCGGATNQTVTLSWAVTPNLTGPGAGTLTMYAKTCGGGIAVGGTSVTGDQFLPVKLIK